MPDNPKYITLNHLRTAISALLNKIDTKPDETELSTVAFTGDYNELINKPYLGNYVNTTTFDSAVAYVDDSYMKIGRDYVTAGQVSSETLGQYATAEGYGVTASGNYSHAEGFYTIASGDYSHAEGWETEASNQYAHTEGYYSTASEYASHAEGDHTIASGMGSHAEGISTIASGDYSHAEGNLNKALYVSDHAEGSKNTAWGGNSHAEGNYTTAFGNGSHTEGYFTIARGNCSHVEGSNENGYTVTLTKTETENIYTINTGNIPTELIPYLRYGFFLGRQGYDNFSYITHITSATENTITVDTSLGFPDNSLSTKLHFPNTIGNYSHSEGINNIAVDEGSYAGGQYNLPLTNMVEVIGNGHVVNSTPIRSNARTLDWNGNETLAGTLTIGGANGWTLSVDSSGNLTMLPASNS